MELLSAAIEEGEEPREIDPAEVEGREQLVIEIWTDGTIDPGEALSLAAQYLAQHSSLISNFNRVVAPLPGRDLPGAIAIPPHLFEMPIDDLNLSMRTYNCLKRSGITKVGQVLRMDRKELLGLRNFGEKSYDELHEALASRSLIPPGTPLDTEGLAAGADGVAPEESDADIEVGYAQFDDIEPEPTGFMQEPEIGGTGGIDQVVDAAGVSEGSMEASAGIYVNDEPASSEMDFAGQTVPIADIMEGDSVVGGEDDLAAEAKPSARSKKKA
jgi:hypothetical protein